VERVGTAVDLDVVDHPGVDGLEVTTTVGLVDRLAVLQQQDPAQVEGALDARAADRQP